MADIQDSYAVAGGVAPRLAARRTASRAPKVCAPRKCEPVLCLPPAAPAGEAIPIWLAALVATRCQAVTGGDDHTVRWDHVSGRALYTNSGSETEVIEPFGVRLQQGHTVAVSWVPGETAYTVEVFRQYDRCA